MIDESTAYWCCWCGENLPDARLHTNTCSARCAAALTSDERRRQREAGETPTRGRKRSIPKSKDHCTACNKPKDNPRHKWCSQCQDTWRQTAAPRA